MLNMTEFAAKLGNMNCLYCLCKNHSAGLFNTKTTASMIIFTTYIVCKKCQLQTNQIQMLQFKQISKMNQTFVAVLSV